MAAMQVGVKPLRPTTATRGVAAALVATDIAERRAICFDFAAGTLSKTSGWGYVSVLWSELR